MKLNQSNPEKHNCVVTTYESMAPAGPSLPHPKDPPLGKAQPGSWLAKHRGMMGKGN